MTKLQSWLSGLLAVQLLLAGGLLWSSYQSNDGNEAEKLFELPVADIDRFVIDDGNKTITLAKNADQWILPDNKNLPATESKVTSTLDSLANISFIWPVSTTTSSHQRFEVEDDNFQRELKLYHGDDLVAQLLIGTSPGFRKVHVRRVGDDEVYAVNLNSFDFPANVDEWLDKGLLTVSDVDQITAPDFTLKKVNDSWQFEKDANVGEGDVPPINTDKAQQLATALSNFRVQGIADGAPEGDAIVIEVVAATEKKRFNFYQNDEVYTVQRDDNDLNFTISKYDFERIAGVNRQDLVVETSADAELKLSPPEEVPSN